MQELTHDLVESREHKSSQATEEKDSINNEIANAMRTGIDKLVRANEWQRVAQSASNCLPEVIIIDEITITGSANGAPENRNGATGTGVVESVSDAGGNADSGPKGSSDGGAIAGADDAKPIDTGDIDDAGTGPVVDLGDIDDAQAASTDGKAEENTCKGTGDAASSTLTPADLKRLFDKNLCRLDKDGDGFVSESEIDAAMKDKSYTGQDAQLVAVLKKHQDELEELSNDEIGDENDGVTAADIVKFDEMQKDIVPEYNANKNMTNYGTENFSKLDANGDGFLTRDELEKAAGDTSLKADEKQAVERMKERLSDIEEASNDEWGDENKGITKADLKEYWEDYRKKDDTKLVERVWGDLHNSGKRLEAANTDCYATANPIDCIEPEAVKQGKIGDCYFMAGVASLAGSNPQAIKDMIKDNGNGTYTVTFPGAPDTPITVDKPTEAELSHYAQPGKYGNWPAILEKAYGKYCNEHWYRRGPKNLGGGDVDQDGADGGSLRNAGLRILTGKGVDSDTMSLTSEAELKQKLSEAFKDGRPVVASINNELGSLVGAADNKVDGLGIPAGHEYTVIGYDEKTGKVKIMNPWGHGEPCDASGKPLDGNDDGVFELTVADFKKYFSSVAYSEK